MIFPSMCRPAAVSAYWGIMAQEKAPCLKYWQVFTYPQAGRSVSRARWLLCLIFLWEWTMKRAVMKIFCKGASTLAFPPNRCSLKWNSLLKRAGWENICICRFGRIRPECGCVGFAISTSIEADILLMDEWLSVGDAEFKEKAGQKLQKIIQKAKILVLASHQEELIHQICNRVITLERGRIVSDRCL